MALGTGSIRFSQIVSEFGGVSPHRFSEYYALNGLGVSGIPASGLMRFSNFRGKSNQVTTSVWVSSGYNQSVWVSLGSRYVLNSVMYLYRDRDNAYEFFYRDGVWGVPYYSGNRIPVNHTTRYTTWWQAGSFRFKSHYSRSYRSSSGNSAYGMYVEQLQDQWVDTSSWQNQTTTAQIST